MISGDKEVHSPSKGREFSALRAIHSETIVQFQLQTNEEWLWLPLSLFDLNELPENSMFLL